MTQEPLYIMNTEIDSFEYWTIPNGKKQVIYELDNYL